MSKFTDAIKHNLRHLPDGAFLSPGACPGCDECGIPHDATDRERVLAEDGSFSRRECESCGSTLGGNRSPAHALDANREILHFVICDECRLFHANGDEPCG